MKYVIWVGDSKKTLKKFPPEVIDEIGHSLYLVQIGEKPRNAKQLKGISPTVMEIVSDYNTNTYRSMYTVKLDEYVYVLHCFNKKSNTGIKTPQKEIKLIKQRLQVAKEYYKANKKQ